MSQAGQGRTRQMGHSEEFWQNVVPWRRKWQPTPIILPGEPHGQYEKAKKTGHWKRSLPRLEGVQYATGGGWRSITNSSRKKEVAGPKWKWCSAVDVSGGESKVQCCKEHYCIGTWNVRSMNQGIRSDQQEIARVSINSLRNQWTKMDRNGQI